MCFESAEDTFAFYVKYVQLASFRMRRNKKRNNGRAQEVECLFSGEKGGLGPDRTRGKITKKKLPSNGVHRMQDQQQCHKGENKRAMHD
jgi:hypothetical protein